jgi:hypothetical protein
MILIPIVSSWFFLQAPGMVTGSVGSAASSVAGRVGSAKEGMASVGRKVRDSTAIGAATFGDRTEEAVEANAEQSSGVPSSGWLASSSRPATVADGGTVTSADSGSATTAGRVRELDRERDRSPMDVAEMKDVFFDSGSGPADD